VRIAVQLGAARPADPCRHGRTSRALSGTA
jgi:hypothetical protein